MTGPKHSHRCMVLAYKRHPDQFKGRPACDCGADILIEQAAATIIEQSLEAHARDCEQEGYTALAAMCRQGADLVRKRTVGIVFCPRCEEPSWGPIQVADHEARCPRQAAPSMAPTLAGRDGSTQIQPGGEP